MYSVLIQMQSYSLCLQSEVCFSQPPVHKPPLMAYSLRDTWLSFALCLLLLTDPHCTNQLQASFFHPQS